MIACIEKAICALLALILEKTKQLDELILQGEANCEKLDAVLDPDTECPTCPEPVTHTFQFAVFDEANGIFDEEYVHTTTVNGGPVSTPFSAAWVNKSEAYAGTVAAVNAIPGVTMTLVTDFALTANGKPVYTITYPEGTPVVIVNQHTGDVYTFTTAEDGSCVGTAVDDQGNPISSYTPVEQ